MSASKRFERDSEDTYDSTKNTFEGQSSGSGILQNENRGHKRMREGDFEFTKPSGSSNEVTSLLFNDNDFLLLDPPSPPYPLDKGCGKRSTGNKPHKRKTGQSSGIVIKILNLLLDLLFLFMQMRLGKGNKMKIRMMIHQLARGLKCLVIMTLLKQEQLLKQKAHHLTVQVCVYTNFANKMFSCHNIIHFQILRILY